MKKRMTGANKRVLEVYFDDFSIWATCWCLCSWFSQRSTNFRDFKWWSALHVLVVMGCYGCCRTLPMSTQVCIDGVF